MNEYIANVKRCSLVGRLLEQEILQWKSFVVVLSCFHQIEYKRSVGVSPFLLVFTSDMRGIELFFLQSTLSGLPSHSFLLLTDKC